jgi:hypothetical protein
VDSDQDDPGAAFYHALGRFQVRCHEVEAALAHRRTHAATEAATGALELWLTASAALLRFEARGLRGADQVPPLGPQLVSARDELAGLLVRAQHEIVEPDLKETIVALRIGLDWAGLGRGAVAHG